MKNLFAQYIIILSVILPTVLLAQSPPFLPPLPEPGTAVVDGNAGEWDLSPSGPDWFANMYEAFNNSGNDRIYSYLYLRYDCQTQTMYVLVYQATYDGTLVPILINGDSWIAIPDQSSKVLEDEDGDDGTPPDFAFIGVGYDGDANHARGWEGSFSIGEVGATTILAHTDVYRSGPQTSGTLTPPISLIIDCGQLPVELSSFTVSHDNNLAQLNWETATEVNNYGFEIERSTEIHEWEKIGFVAGHGNSNSPKYYSFADKSLNESGEYYYRLKQIDIDGKFEYSDIVNVFMGTPDNFSLNQNYPNPFNPSTTINYSIPADANVEIVVYDMLGNEVAVLEKGNKTAGKYNVVFDATNYSSGFYFYTITAGNYTMTKKMLLMK